MKTALDQPAIIAESIVTVMSKRCRDCQGRGRWQEMKNLADGTTELVWRYCDSCLGTGLELDPDEGGDFSIDGGEDDD